MSSDSNRKVGRQIWLFKLFLKFIFCIIGEDRALITVQELYARLRFE